MHSKNLQASVGLPLGLIIIDTMAVAAGYREQGAENDSAIVTAVMRVLKDTAERLSCFVLGVDHYGKSKADQGVELPIPPDGPIVRMVDQKKVRKQFCTHTPTDDSANKGKLQRQQFDRARDWAEDEELIAIEEIDDVTYLRLIRPDPETDDEEGSD